MGPVDLMGPWAWWWGRWTRKQLRSTQSYLRRSQKQVWCWCCWMGAAGKLWSHVWWPLVLTIKVQWMLLHWAKWDINLPRSSLSLVTQSLLICFHWLRGFLDASAHLLCLASQNNDYQQMPPLFPETLSHRNGLLRGMDSFDHFPSPFFSVRNHGCVCVELCHPFSGVRIGTCLLFMLFGKVSYLLMVLY